MNKIFDLSFLLSCLKNYYQISQRRFYEADELARDLKLDLDFILASLELTEKQQQVLELHFKQGYTQEELGVSWGTSQENIYYHMKAVRNKLEKALKELHYND